MSQVPSLVNKELETLKQRLAEAENTARLVANTLNLIGEMEIKAAYAKPVYELQSFWESFYKGLQAQIEMIKNALPKEPVAGETATQVNNPPETPAAALELPKKIELEVK